MISVIFTANFITELFLETNKNQPIFIIYLNIYSVYASSCFKNTELLLLRELLKMSCEMPGGWAAFKKCTAENSIVGFQINYLVYL